MKERRKDRKEGDDMNEMKRGHSFFVVFYFNLPNKSLPVH